MGSPRTANRSVSRCASVNPSGTQLDRGPSHSRLLFLNRVYPPNVGATGQLLEELAIHLAAAGFEIRVVAGPATAEGPTLKNEYPRIERAPGLPFTRRSHWRRALSYCSLYPAMLWRACRGPRPDLVVSLTDPPLLLVLGVAVKWIRRCRAVHWAQDLYPELAEELGVLRKGGWSAGVLRAISTWALRRHDRIIAVGRCMRDRLIARGIPSDRITVIPNWAPLPEESEKRENRAETDAYRLVVMYSGNFGLAHPFEAILEAAAVLQERGSAVHFVMVGEGPRLGWVRDEVGRLGLGNVEFRPFTPKAELAQSLASADVHLASMHEKLCGLVVPSKVYGILAAGRPCIFLGPEAGEAARVLQEFDCGIVLESATGGQLAKVLEEWREQGKGAARYEGNARTAARAHSLGRVAARFEAAFREILGTGKAL